MSLDAIHSRLTKVGRIVIEGGHVLVEGFDGDNCSCRDVAVLACMAWKCWRWKPARPSSNQAAAMS